MKNQYSNFDWQIPSIVASLPKGNDAEKLFEAYQTEAKKFSNNAQLNVLKYNKNSKEIYNSNVFVSGLLNKLLSKSNLRVSVPGDDFNGDIYKLVKDKHYTDFNALVCQEKAPSYEKEKNLWEKVIKLAEKKHGKVKFPFMIQGFYIAPDETEKNYGVKIIPASNFEIIEDERLSIKYNSWKFDSIDKKGIPLSLDKNKGSRTFYTMENGLSRVCLDGIGSLGVRGDYLGVSGDFGRVVIVSTEGANAKNFMQEIIKEKREKLNLLEKKYLEEIKNI